MFRTLLFVCALSLSLLALTTVVRASPEETIVVDPKSEKHKYFQCPAQSTTLVYHTDANPVTDTNKPHTFTAKANTVTKIPFRVDIRKSTSQTFNAIGLYVLSVKAGTSYRVGLLDRFSNTQVSSVSQHVDVDIHDDDGHNIEIPFTAFHAPQAQHHHYSILIWTNGDIVLPLGMPESHENNTASYDAPYPAENDDTVPIPMPHELQDLHVEQFGIVNATLIACRMKPIKLHEPHQCNEKEHVGFTVGKDEHSNKEGTKEFGLLGHTVVLAQTHVTAEHGRQIEGVAIHVLTMHVNTLYRVGLFNNSHDLVAESELQTAQYAIAEETTIDIPFQHPFDHFEHADSQVVTNPSYYVALWVDTTTHVRALSGNHGFTVLSGECPTFVGHSFKELEPCGFHTFNADKHLIALHLIECSDEPLHAGEEEHDEHDHHDNEDHDSLGHVAAAHRNLLSNAPVTSNMSLFAIEMTIAVLIILIIVILGTMYWLHRSVSVSAVEPIRSSTISTPSSMGSSAFAAKLEHRQFSMNESGLSRTASYRNPLAKPTAGDHDGL